MMLLSQLPAMRHVLWQGALFGFASGGMFAALGVVCYAAYGQDYLQEAFLHHLTRRDPRHNFSSYFYPIYLEHYSGSADPGAGLRGGAGQPDAAACAFAPQAVLLLTLAVRFHRNLPLCWLLQTIAFVALNKVRSGGRAQPHHLLPDRGLPESTISLQKHYTLLCTIRVWCFLCTLVCGVVMSVGGGIQLVSQLEQAPQQQTK